MKQKDLAMIIIVAAISGMLSFALSHLIFGAPQQRQQQAAVVDAITTTFTMPDPKFFNNQSINPAQLIEVGSSNNTNPFNGSGH